MCVCVCVCGVCVVCVWCVSVCCIPFGCACSSSMVSPQSWGSEGTNRGCLPSSASRQAAMVRLNGTACQTYTGGAETSTVHTKAHTCMCRRTWSRAWLPATYKPTGYINSTQLWSEIALPGTALSLTDMYTKGLSNLINTLAQSSMSASVPTLNQQVNSGRQTDTAGCRVQTCSVVVPLSNL